MNTPGTISDRSSDSTPATPTGATPAANEQELPEDWGHDLRLYGYEQILRGSDTGVLVAFAALAFQQIRGGNPSPVHNVGHGFLIFSVLLCGIVHYAIGHVYIGRGRRLIDRQKETRRQKVGRGIYSTLAWTAGLLQFLFIAIGLLLILSPNLPAWLHDYFLKYFL